MQLTGWLLNVALFGAEWVLWLLIALSIVSIGLMLERALYFRRTRVDADDLQLDLRRLLGRGDRAGATALLERHIGSIESDVLAAGLARLDAGAGAAGEAMAGAKTRGKLRLTRNLPFLGTLGSNAPFIGLFGTVLGVIKAFHDLAAKKGAGPEAVMGSLSEALIATGVGLLVAIPAVVAFNYFQGIVRRRAAQAEALSRELLATIAEGGAAREGA